MTNTTKVQADTAASDKADATGGSRSAVSADDVARSLRHRIQTNELAPGEWLRENRVCKEFEIGRSIARRALRILGEDGLVEIEENRGARVSTTTVEEVFDLYEVRAALYGLAARFACMRAPDEEVQRILAEIDALLQAHEDGADAEAIIEMSEALFSRMASFASPDAQRMIASVRRKTRFHFSYVALALADGPGPFVFWRKLRDALAERKVAEVSQAARDILYFMQGEVAQIMLSQGRRSRAG